MEKEIISIFVSFVPIEMNGSGSRLPRQMKIFVSTAPGARSNCFAVNDRVSPVINDSA